MYKYIIKYQWWPKLNWSFGMITVLEYFDEYKKDASTLYRVSKTIFLGKEMASLTQKIWIVCW